MNVTAVTNHFLTANKGFITTLGSTISAGAATVPLTSVSGLTNGTIFVGIIEPGLSNEQEFTGTVDTAGVQITGVKWTDGTNVDHTAGVTIVDYVSATGQNMLLKGLLVHADQDGTLKAGAVDVAGVLASNVVTYPKLESELQGGWNSTSALPAISAVVASGNRSYTLTHASSIASVVSAGMRRRFTRTSAAPVTCFSLDGSNDYFNDTTVSGMTFTDDFVVSAWIKVSSYATAGIVSRYNGTSGWFFRLESDGRVGFYGINAGASNSRGVLSYQSVPLNKWVHVAAQIDMSTYTLSTTTMYIMIDGKDVPATLAQSGTNPTALIQAGDLQIGASNGTNFFPGKIAQVAIYSAKVTQATILASIDRGLTGSETSLISAYSGANTTDLNTTNANNLTAQNSAVSGYADAPFGNGGISSTLEYALSMSVSSDGLTEVVQCPEACALPTTGGITASAYSTQANPFGWVSDKGRWEVSALQRVSSTAGSVTTTVAANINSFYVNVPIGNWEIRGQGSAQGNTNAANAIELRAGLSSTTNTFSLIGNYCAGSSSSTTYVLGSFFAESTVALSTAANYYLNLMVNGTGTLTAQVRGDVGGSKIYVIPSGL